MYAFVDVDPRGRLPMNHKLFAGVLFCSALISAPSLVGCCKGKGSGTSSASGTTGEVATIPEAGVKFNAPGGWTRYSTDRWVRFKPDDNGARLAFVTFNRPNESTALIGQISRNLDITGLSWRSINVAPIGPNQLTTPVSGETTPGGCKLASSGADCYAWYTTVNPGGSTQILIVYTVVSSKAAIHKPNAEAAIRTLSKI